MSDRVASSAVSMSRSRASWRDPGRHQRDGGAQVAVEHAVAAPRTWAAAAASTPSRMAASSNSPGARRAGGGRRGRGRCAARRATWAAAGRCPPAPGRAARSAPAGRCRRPGAHARPRRSAPRRRHGRCSDRASLMRTRPPPGRGRPGSCGAAGSHSVGAHSSRPRASSSAPRGCRAARAGGRRRRPRRPGWSCAERAAQPVGEAVGLRQLHAQQPLDAARRATGSRSPTNPAATWVSNSASRDGAAGQLEHLEVLVGGVDDGHGGPSRPWRAARGRRPAGRRAPIPLATRAAPGPAGEVGALAVELGVERVGLDLDQLVDDRANAASSSIHVTSSTSDSSLPRAGLVLRKPPDTPSARRFAGDDGLPAAIQASCRRPR